MRSLQKEGARNAVWLGALCAGTYMTAYFGRNILGTVSPQMIEGGGYTAEYIGQVSSCFFAFYAVGQLVNGIIGEHVKARTMMSLGLFLAGVCNLLFLFLPASPVAMILYGMMGCFLAMIYAPMTKVVAENTEPLYTQRCCVAFSVSSLLASPLAGVAAAIFHWKRVFFWASVIMMTVAVGCFLAFLGMEKRGMVVYNRQGKREKNIDKKSAVKVLLRHRIVTFTVISILTGVVRISVVFWLPTYFSQYLEYETEMAAGIFTVATVCVSVAPFACTFVYEKWNRDMDKSAFRMFLLSAVSFGLAYAVKLSVVNVIFIVLAVLASNTVSYLLWTIYCPNLKDTGLVSAATGYLDFVNYMAASICSSIFAYLIPDIGWKNLILIWAILMGTGALLMAYQRRKAWSGNLD